MGNKCRLVSISHCQIYVAVTIKALNQQKLKQCFNEDNAESSQKGHMQSKKNKFCMQYYKPRYLSLSYDVASESVIKPCIKNDNPLVD